MNARRTKSGGQAIVMVTLALFAMAGMMGLALDLGWSYFIQKQAQNAADGAALAAVHEFYQRLGGDVSLTGCPTASNIDCNDTAETCGGSITSGGGLNTYNGCLYAKANGFNWDVSTSNQTVTMVANMGGSGFGGSNPASVSGVNNIAYWVTATATQTVPQLFSSLLGRTNAVVSASGTAAVVAQHLPGSFIGMDREGDCFVGYNGNNDCGTDLDVAGGSAKDCPGETAVHGKVCGPLGIFLSSQCNGTSLPSGSPTGGCGSGNSNYAGTVHSNGANVWGSVIGVRGSGNVNLPGSSWYCGANATTTNCPQLNMGNGIFTDPEQGSPQPPLSTSSAIPVCPVLTGTIPAGTYGPFQYVSYNSTATKSGTTYYFDQSRISVAGTTNFATSGWSTTGGCPSYNIGGGAANAPIGGTPQTGSFPTTIFWGGLNLSGTVGFGPGEYVVAGTSQLNTSPTNGTLLNISGTVTTSTSTGGGNLFVLTCYSGTNGCGSGYDVNSGGVATYPLSTQAGVMTTVAADATPPMTVAFSTLTFNYGSTQWGGNTSGAGLTGMDGTVSAVQSAGLVQWANILFWQDRGNSTLTYDSLGNVTSQTNANCSGTSTNTCYSPGWFFNGGNTSAIMTGVLYQPRGAWLEFSPGDDSISSSPLQIITGAAVTDNGGGNSRIILLGTAKPILTYRTTLVH